MESVVSTRVKRARKYNTYSYVNTVENKQTNNQVREKASERESEREYASENIVFEFLSQPHTSGKSTTTTITKPIRYNKQLRYKYIKSCHRTSTAWVRKPSTKTSEKLEIFVLSVVGCFFKKKKLFNCSWTLLCKKRTALSSTFFWAVCVGCISICIHACILHSNTALILTVYHRLYWMLLQMNIYHTNITSVEWKATKKNQPARNKMKWEKKRLTKKKEDQRQAKTRALKHVPLSYGQNTYVFGSFCCKRFVRSSLSHCLPV